MAKLCSLAILCMVIFSGSVNAEDMVFADSLVSLCQKGLYKECIQLLEPLAQAKNERRLPALILIEKFQDARNNPYSRGQSAKIQRIIWEDYPDESQYLKDMLGKNNVRFDEERITLEDLNELDSAIKILIRKSDVANLRKIQAKLRNLADYEREDSRAALLMVRISNALGDSLFTERYLEKARSISPDNPEVRYHQAISRLLLGDYDSFLIAYLLWINAENNSDRLRMECRLLSVAANDEELIDFGNAGIEGLKQFLKNLWQQNVHGGSINYKGAMVRKYYRWMVLFARDEVVTEEGLKHSMKNPGIAMAVGLGPGFLMSGAGFFYAGSKPIGFAVLVTKTYALLGGIAAGFGNIEGNTHDNSESEKFGRLFIGMWLFDIAGSAVKIYFDNKKKWKNFHAHPYIRNEGGKNQIGITLSIGF